VISGRHVIGGAIVGAVAALLVVPALHYGGLNMDEGLLLVYPELVLRGAVPNRDFLMSYGPGDFWLLAGLYSLFGAHVEIERLVGLGYHVLIAVALFAHASRWGPAVGVFSGIIAAFILVPLGTAAFAFLGAVALVLWSLFVLTVASRSLAVGLAGALAGLAIVFRPELAPATALALLPLALRRDKRHQQALIGGGALAILPLGIHLLLAGPAAVFDNLVLSVFKWGPARYLPLPGRDPALLVLLAIADVGLLIAAARAVRAERSPRTRSLAALAVFSLLTLAQGIQRSDDFHLLSAGTVPLALLPVTIAALLARVPRPTFGRYRELAAVLAAALLIAAGGPKIMARAALIELPRAVGLETFEQYTVEHGGRIWYPLRQSAEFTSTPVGSVASAMELQQTLDEVDRLAAPETRLFVGPLDLRRTNVTDTVIYYLLPQLRPATYYLEMAPGTTNGPGSHLAADIASADVLVLTSRYDDWDEPNASQLFGPDAPNAIVRERFDLRAQHGTYSIYVRRASSVASEREAVTAR
jgi:hypothetical protein